MKRIIQFLCLCFLFTNCVNKVETKKVTLEIDLVAVKPDSIRVFYTIDNSVNFNEKQAVWKKIKGSTKNQKITIEIPEKVLPHQLRMDFGKNQKNHEIVLNKIHVIYLESSFEAKGEEIYWYFRPDENNTLLDKKSGVLKRKYSGQLSSPSLYPNGDKLYNKLNQLYNTKTNN